MRPRVVARDEEATQTISALARDHQAALYAMALKMARDPGDARDLVQDTFERALRNLSQFEPGSNARAWLITILHNLFIDRCRRRAREPLTESIEQHTVAAAGDAEPDPKWTRVTPEQLRAAIAELPEEFRRAFELHAIEGRSYVEIAESLGIAKATVGTRLIRARRKLKAILARHLGGETEGSE